MHKLWLLKAVSQARRKPKCKRRSHVERKQNEIHTRSSLSQDGGNLVPRVRVTLDQQSGTRTLGTRLRMADEVDVFAYLISPRSSSVQENKKYILIITILLCL